LQLSQIEQLTKPDQDDLKLFKEWIANKKKGASLGGKNFPQCTEVHTWEDLDDLITFHQDRKSQDRFSMWLTKKPLEWYHSHWKVKRSIDPVDEELGLTTYKQDGLQRIGDGVAACFAILLPIAAIFVLYYVKNTLARLLIMVGFTLAFWLVILWFTMSRVEMFTAVAGLVTYCSLLGITSLTLVCRFAAIEVVFIGSVSG